MNLKVRARAVPEQLCIGVLTRVLTTQPAFSGATSEELRTRVLYARPAPISVLYSRELRAVCELMLQKDVARRGAISGLKRMPKPLEVRAAALFL